MSKQEGTGDNFRGIMDATKLGKPKMLLLGAQHMFAMFGATVLVPALTGLDVSTTLLFAGIGTLLFHLLTKGNVPLFLGSSFAFLAGYSVIAGGFAGSEGFDASLLPYASLGVAFAGLVYLLVAGLFKAYGATKVMRFFPPIVTGPIIIAIGLNLSYVAINSSSNNWWLALLAIVTIIGCNIWGKGMIKIIPIILGVIVSYLAAGVTGNVDWTLVRDAAWFGVPVKWDQTVFSLFGNADTAFMITAIITIMPIALATIVEHIGDMSAISSTVGKNYIKDPGLHRTLLGDGITTVTAALFGAPANTTYGENIGVLNLTRVFDPKVIRIGAVFAMLFAFSPKLGAVISCIPVATMGGVSLILYGMIAAVGVRNIVEHKVDFTNSRNFIIAALILVLSTGIHYSDIGAIAFNIGDMTISLSGLSVGALVGIIVNAILPGKDYKFDDGKDEVKEEVK
ncbi:MAG: uracil-xanthine permease family protein [Lachnospiraceae bacterium]|jgi:uracil permease|nr:uracil-xanthine permease family protein [Lachnospiraceae bacterium]